MTYRSLHRISMALESADIAAAQLNADRFVHRMTSEMERLLATEQLVALRANRLCGTTNSSRRAIQRLISTAMDDAETAAAPKAHIWDRSGFCWRCTAVIASEPKRTAHRSEILLVLNSVNDPAAATEMLKRRYDLTPAECTCALKLTECGNVPKLAKRLHVAPNTVRTHLKSIYNKIGVHGQVELVALLARQGFCKQTGITFE